MGSLLFKIFYGCLKFRFPDVEENPGPRATPRQKCKVLFSNINGLHGNLAELAVAATEVDVVACAETKVSARRHLAELALPGFLSPVLLLRGDRPNGLGMAIYVRTGFSVIRQSKFECACCEFMVVKVAGRRLNFYLVFVYRSPNTDDRVYDCLSEVMGKVQSEDSKSAFCFVGDFNCHHTDWLGSRTTNAHGVAAYDFASVTDCSQLVHVPTHRGGGILDLVMTNVPDLCRVEVQGCIGRSDHSTIRLALDLAPSVPGFDVACRVPLKSRVNWNGVRAALLGIRWGPLFRSPTMIDVLDDQLNRIIEQFVPFVTIRKRMGDSPWFDAECRLSFELKQSAYYRWCGDRNGGNWDLYLQARGAAEACYAAAKFRYSERCKEQLLSSSTPQAWWSTLREHVFGVSSAIPPLQAPGGALVSDPAGKGELLSSYFDSKQSRDDLQLPSTCHPEPLFCSFAFRSKEVAGLLMNLDKHGGMDPSGCFPLFFRETASVLAPKLSCIFRKLLRGGGFPAQWRVADITPIPKGPVSSLLSGYRPISITPVLSKIYERLISVRLYRFMESRGIFPLHQYSYRKNLGTCDALLDIICTGQSALDGGGELALIQLDFSAAFDRVNHAGLLFKLCDAGVGGPVLSVLTNFLSGRTQRVKIDGVRSSVVSVISGVPQGSVLGPLLFLLYIRDLPLLLENVLVGYADDSTLIAPVSCPRDRVLVAASLNRDLDVIVAWCSRWGMLINSSKTYGMIVSRSRTIAPSFPDFVIGGSAIMLVNELKILGVVIDSKLTFESHVRGIAAAASRRVGILRKSLTVYGDRSVASRCFWSFVLPVFEYCSPVWMSAASSYLALLDRVVRHASRLCGGDIGCDLWYRRRVSALCVFYRIRVMMTHPVKELFPPLHVAGRNTRGALAAHSVTLAYPRCRSAQFSRTFVPACVGWWNALEESDFAGECLDDFKAAIKSTLLLLFN